MPDREVRAASTSASKARSCSAPCSATPSPISTGSPWLGVLAGGCAGILLGAMHGVLCSLPQGQRHRRRHRHDVARHRPRLLLRQALHPAAGAASALDPARRLDRQSASSRWRCSINPLFFVGIVAALAMAWAFRNTRWGLIVRTTGDSAAAARAMGVSVDTRAVPGDRGRRLPGRRRRLVPVALLSRLVERGPVLGPGPDGGGARHLRALGPDPLRAGGAAVRRRRRARAGAAVGRHHAGLLPVQRGPLHPDAADHDRRPPTRNRRFRAAPGELSITK